MTTRYHDSIYGSAVNVTTNSSTTLYTTRAIPTGGVQHIDVIVMSDVDTSPASTAGSTRLQAFVKNVAGTLTVISTGGALPLKDAGTVPTINFTISGTQILIQVSVTESTPNEQWVAVGNVYTFLH